MISIRKELQTFNGIIKEIDSLYSELAKQSKLTDSAFWVLYYLAQMEEEITQKSICKQWVLSKQTVNNAIRDLQKKEYICLVESENDRRNKQIILTDKGKEFTKEHIESIFLMEERIFALMSKKEVEGLLTSNAKYLQLLREQIKPKQ